ncbi:MAG: 50S ribosomal protein L23 [Aerococcus sp.]|nr:50S ribosomal protein L23 [Aerococcus sp.]
MHAEDVIIRPVITEKSMDAMDEDKYTFEVSIHASKSRVRQAIEELFDVKVKNVNIVNVHAKKKRVGQYTGKTARRRKAIVTLAEGDSIEIFPTTQDNEE